MICARKGCNFTLISQRQWQKLTREERVELEARGISRNGGRGLCRRCYETEPLMKHSRQTHPIGEVLEELEHLGFDTRLPLGPQFQEFAPQLGMRVKTLQKAWYRHTSKTRGRKVS